KDGNVHIYDWARARELHKFAAGKSKDDDRPPFLRVASWGISYAPDGKSLATRQKGEVKLWNAETGAEIHTIRDEKLSQSGVAFSPDGKTLAIVTTDAIVLVEPGSGKKFGELRGDKPSGRFARFIVFGKDGSKLYEIKPPLSGIVEWDLATG